MGALDMLTMLVLHPVEFRTLIQYKLYHEKKRDITAQQEHPTSGWDRKSMRRCWEFLDMTSRSFSAVIKELDGDLARTIALFYLVLRGLDTIEDDMTIPDEKKQPLLRTFHEKTVTPGWTFDGNGPDEKDRQLLVEYDVVTEEMGLLDPNYREVIVDICHKMEDGMADFAHKAATTGRIYLDTIEDYDLYCHYVAGLVGEGLSRLFSASGKEANWLQYQLEISNSMGLLLQKTNIIRDFREDIEEKRYFWPKEIWGREDYGGFTEMAQLAQPENERNALWAVSGMVVDALRHATDALDYLRVLKNQSVFNFCAIPATMAMATLELVFMNPEMLQRNVKIRKAAAAKLIMASTNPRDVAYLFRDSARKIHAKASPADPNFLRISVACGKIEQWCERQFPSFVRMQQSGTSGDVYQMLDPFDARTRIVELDKKREQQLAIEKRALAAGLDPQQIRQPQQTSTMEIAGLVAAMVGFILIISLGVIWAVLKYFPDN
ncbi:farnesyl-diphosphate farnesyltransferase [Punctularia strigosozonata HHB-11173 SS5]|uniref:farnesyl-diphosphate farnesyltransferase n=1 Tax=Punctularia strigosozonata (strain HHB-11173) TaxID=741275 RepID=UPI00044185A8|nr:farnesyl-diphosphate farnesyltransferase [Punctularia strigosozonata HHB-11173 SS5]EIN12766.1 farnesyl-diphosphate farnesyltransferase [Punctularia strigosozonata HHB-11173 SS5]